MYHYHSYPDPFLPPLCFASASPSQSPPRPPPHHQDYTHHHLYPPSPPQGASPSSDGSFFLNPPTPYFPSIPSYCLQSTGGSFSNGLLDGDVHRCGGGSSSSGNSPHLSDQPDFLDLQADYLMSRGLGTEDVQGTNYNQEAGGGGGVAPPASRVGRYNAEERKERIERYRSKRNQRNFQKKITYACRKTLADSRPRVRGRFARNGEAEQETEVDGEAAEMSSCNNSSSQSAGERYGWRRVAEDEDEYACDPEFWANFLDNFSMNNLIT